MLFNRNLKHTLNGHANLITRISWSPDGTILASGSNDQTIKLWDIEGNSADTFPSPYNTIKHLVWSPDGSSIAISSIYNDIYIMNSRSGTPEGRVVGHSGWVTSLDWAPDGNSIVSSCADQTIRIWYSRNYLVLETLEGHANLIRCVSWSPDGTMIASSSSSGKIRLWDTSSWKQVRILRGHLSSVDCLAWSPDNKMLVSSSNDSNIGIWNPANGKNIKVLKPKQENITGLSFSADGSIFASMDEKGKVYFWYCKTWDIIDIFNEPSEGKLRGGIAFNPRTKMVALINQEKGEINLYEFETDSKTFRQSSHNLEDSFVCHICEEIIPARIVNKRQKLGHSTVTCPMCDSCIQISDAKKLEEAPLSKNESIDHNILNQPDTIEQSTQKIDNFKDEDELFEQESYSTPENMQENKTNDQSFRTWAGCSKCTLAFVFTDILGSTELCNLLGNEGFNKLRNAHFTKAKHLIIKHNGYKIKTIGDSVMAAFHAASEAFDFALDFYTTTGNDKIKIRAGIHVGPVTIEQNDAFGITINYTSRIEQIAQKSEIWVSDDAKTHIDQDGLEKHSKIEWILHPDCILKGFKGKHSLWSVSNH